MQKRVFTLIYRNFKISVPISDFSAHVYSRLGRDRYFYQGVIDMREEGGERGKEKKNRLSLSTSSLPSFTEIE